MTRARTLYAALARPLTLAATLIGAAAISLPAHAASYRGTLTIVWGDPAHPSAGGGVRFEIAGADGRSYALRLPASQQSLAMQYFNKRVTVTGQPVTAAGGAPAIAATHIALAGAAEPRSPAAATRRVIFLLLKYQGDSQEPHDPGFYTALTNPKKGNASLKIPASINGFFAKTSWGQLQWAADVGGAGGLNPTDWFTLPHPKSYYANCGWDGSCANLDAIAADAEALAVKAGIQLSDYDNINFVLNNDLDCCAWGGSTVYNGKVYGATWEPPWGQETGTYSHEFGHSIGLPHSGWVYYDYDSPWDVMSLRTASKSLECATYNSANDGKKDPVYCTEPGDGYIAPHKDYLGWLPAQNQVVIDQAETKTVTLEADAWPLKTGIKMIKICLAGEPCTGTTAHYITVEARIGGKKYDKGLTGDGVLVQDFLADRSPISGNCFFNNQSGWVLPIDATPGDYDSKACDSGGRKWPNYALGNAEFLPGQTYSDSKLHISVQVKSKSKSSYAVTVTRSQ